MKENRTIFDHIGSIFTIFGFSMIVMMIFCKIFGESAKELSAMFQLGSQGVALETMSQYLLVAVLIEILRTFFFHEKVLKNCSVVTRSACMLGTVIVMMVVVIIAFDWFPTGVWEAWVAFLVCFFLSFGVSVWVMHVKEKLENKQMEEGLLRFQKELEEKEQ